jgi:hypothetical protein
MNEVGDRALLNAFLRSDLVAFIEKVFETVAPGDRFVPNWHIEAIAHALRRCLEGETTRLAITQPPRSLKSICAIAFAAWALGHDPTLTFISISYAQDLAFDHARLFRRVIESDWYQDLFPQMRLSKATDGEVVTKAGGGRFATTVGGTLTGRGADIIIIDDPMKAEDAASLAARRRVIQWYQGTLSTRLNDKKKGVIILIMQRLHEDDLVGYVLSGGAWSQLCLPAKAVEGEVIELGHGRVHSVRHQHL